MTIELSAEKPRKHEFYRATLDLPATDLQIEDALSKARFQNESSKKYIDIENTFRSFSSVGHRRRYSYAELFGKAP